MTAMRKEVQPLNHIPDEKLIIAKIDYVQMSVDSVDKKIEKLDARMWQIIILLLSYPLGLIVGKITHIF